MVVAADAVLDALAAAGSTVCVMLLAAAFARGSVCVLVEVPKGVHDCFFLPFFDPVPGAAALGLDGIAAFVLAQCEGRE